MGAPVSLCMIVRNERAYLEEALLSVRGMVDQVLVGDTGSTDGTQALAASLGATVLDVPWTDDFAAARNAVLAHADRAWVLYFDADERATPSVGRWLAHHLPATGSDGFRGAFVSRSTRRGFDRLCLFPNHQGIRWQRALHEWPVWPTGGAVHGLLVPDLRFEHVGDQRPQGDENRKHERYLAIEQAMLAAEPASQVERYYVVMSLMVLKRYDDAYEVCLAAWNRPEWRANWKPGTLAWHLAEISRQMPHWERFRYWAAVCVAEVPAMVLGWELLVRGLHAHEGLAACAVPAQCWFHACRQGGALAESQLASHPEMLPMAWRYYVWTRYAVGDVDAGRHWAYHPDAPRDLAIHADLLAGDLARAIRRYTAGLADPQRALATWRGWQDAASPVPELLPAVIWGGLGHRHYRELAAERFDAVVQAFPDEVAPRWRRAAFRLQGGADAEGALADMRWVTARAPGNAGAWRLLATAAERCGLTEEAAQAAQRAIAVG